MFAEENLAFNPIKTETLGDSGRGGRGGLSPLFIS